MEKEILKRLCKEILKELERRNISYTYFADFCGISRKIMADIVNQTKTDMKLSTIIKICENSNIRIEDIFSDRERNEEIKNRIRNAYIVINGTRFSIELKEYSTPPHAV